MIACCAGPKGVVHVGVYFLLFVVLLRFIYLGYALFRPEKF
ncbi:MAG: potassium-transporting ATPase subunit F [Chloroflexi bacterium]|nr:potassium-transporting ATPase subunit F [Chloroflexota bacterium]